MQSLSQSVRKLMRPDGRALVVAMDHGLTHGPAKGLEDPAALIETVIAAGADAIMTSYGVVKKYGHLLRDKVPVIVRIDGGPSDRTGTWREYTDWRRMFTVEDALQLGADAVVIMHFVGAPVEVDTLASLAHTAAACTRLHVPLLVEALPCPHPNIPNIFDADALAIVARIAAEYGADIVKTTYSGDAASFSKVVQKATVPVLVLGGERVDSLRAVLELTHGATEAGGAGVAIGRNIWQSPNPAGVVKALAAIIHDGAPVDAAMELL